MFDFENMMSKKKLLFGGIVLFVVILLLVLFFMNRSSSTPSSPTPETDTTGSAPITPRTIQGRSGADNSALQRKPTKTPQKQRDELQELSPIQGDGFILTFNPSTKKYDVYISAPYENSKQEVIEWLSIAYPSISPQTLHFLNVSSSPSDGLPYEGEGFVMTQQPDDSYLAFLSDPFPVSQNAAQASIITSQDPTSQPIIAYVPIYNNA
ncbi:hypothetical protein KBD81_02560, partial [Candidatus Woesebacteria bacterium]|nr:hypothetical protein [Candidatus Woesebacteria bacterium]